MTTLLAMTLVLMALALVAIMFRDHKRGTCELLSCRNIALVGLILFQLGSCAYSLFTGDNSVFRINNLVWTGFQFVVMAAIFIFLSLWSYRQGWLVTTLASKLPTTHAMPSDTALLFNAALLAGLSVVLRFGVGIPLVAIVAGTVGIGLSAVSCGLVGWVWGRRMLNPAVIFYSLLIVAADLAIVMSLSFGRRGLVAVGGAIIWGMYYSAWRHMRTRKILTRMTLVSLAPVIFLALFTSVRSSGEHQRSAGDHLRKMSEGGNLVRGIVSLASGQYAGSISLFLIENYPENQEYRHMESVYYFFILPVPRMWWPNKPIPLSMEIAREARMSRVNWSRLKLGPGIIGHAAAEGGWYALIIYGLIAGMFFRFFDEIIRINIDSPFVVLAVGSALGQFLGLPRGSVPNFAFLAVLTIGGAMVVMIVLGKIVEQFSPSPIPDDESYDSGEWDYEDDDGSNP